MAKRDTKTSRMLQQMAAEAQATTPSASGQTDKTERMLTPDEMMRFARAVETCQSGGIVCIEKRVEKIIVPNDKWNEVVAKITEARKEAEASWDTKMEEAERRIRLVISAATTESISRIREANSEGNSFFFRWNPEHFPPFSEGGWKHWLITLTLPIAIAVALSIILQLGIWIGQMMP